MQVVLGCTASNAPPSLEDTVQKRLARTEAEIAGPGNETGEFHAGFLHGWNDINRVFGENFGSLKALKKKYDPDDRFNKSVNLSGWVGKSREHG